MIYYIYKLSFKRCHNEKLKNILTSDLHGYVYPTDYVYKSEKNIGLLNIINQFEKYGNTLIIDAGDTIQGSPFTNYLKKYFIISVYWSCAFRQVSIKYPFSLLVWYWFNPL